MRSRASRSRTRSSTATSPFQRGTAQAALRHRNFRIVYFGTFASNIGTWMQNVVLGAYAFKLTGSSAYVGVVFFAQLGPLLFLSTLGGLLADVVDRRRFLVERAARAARALVRARGHRARRRSVARADRRRACSRSASRTRSARPGLNAILPTLVPREDLPGAVALASVQMNLSRVIGPLIGALIYSRSSAAPVFAINALTYLFAVDRPAVGAVPAPHATPGSRSRASPGSLSGVRIARRDPLLSHILLTLFSFSFFSLAFVGLMPVIADAELRHRAEELCSTACSTRASASAPRSAR